MDETASFVCFEYLRLLRLRVSVGIESHDTNHSFRSRYGFGKRDEPCAGILYSQRSPNGIANSQRSFAGKNGKTTYIGSANAGPHP